MEDHEKYLPDELLDRVGINGATEMLADAIERWGDRNGDNRTPLDGYCREYANKLRELAAKG